MEYRSDECYGEEYHAIYYLIRENKHLMTTISAFRRIIKSISRHYYRLLDIEDYANLRDDEEYDGKSTRVRIENAKRRYRYFTDILRAAIARRKQAKKDRRKNRTTDVVRQMIFISLYDLQRLEYECDYDMAPWYGRDPSEYVYIPHGWPDPSNISSEVIQFVHKNFS